MSEDVSAGRLHMDAYVDTTGVARGLQQKINQQVAGVRAKIKAEIDTRGSVASAKAAAAEASKAAVVSLKVKLDSRGVIGEAKRIAKEASKAAVVTVKTEVDAKSMAVATAKVAAIAGDHTAHVRVEADTAAALAKIAAVKAAAAAAAGGASGAAGAAAGAGGGGAQAAAEGTGAALGGVATQAQAASAGLAKMAMMVGGIYQLGAAVGQLGGGLVSIVASAGSAAGALALLPNLIGIMGQGVGTLIGGFSGMGDAVTALTANEQQSAQNATAAAQARAAAADRVRSAQQAVASSSRGVIAAEQGVKDAMKSAADGARAAANAISDAQWSLARSADAVRNAREALGNARYQAGQTAQADAARIVASEQAIHDAVQSERDAREALAQAYIDARQHIRDLNRELALAAGDEQIAIAAVQKAKEDLQDVQWDASSSEQERRAAETNLLAAEQNLKRTRAGRKQLARDAAKANKDGVKGSDIVQNAQDNLTNAVQAEADARRQLAADRKQQKHDAVQSARSIRDAEEGVRNAIHAQQEARQALQEAERAQADQAVAGARAIADAQQRVKDAELASANAKRGLNRALADQKKVNGEVATTLVAQQQALDNLSPAGQRFAKFLAFTLLPRFKQMKFAIQESLLPPLQRGITKAMPLLDTVQRGVVGTARVIGGFAEKLGTLFGKKTFNTDVAGIMKVNNRALRIFLGAGKNLIKMLVDVAAVAGPKLLVPFAKWTRALTKSWQEAAHTGRESGKMGEFFDRVRKRAKLLWGILVNLAGTIKGIGKAAAPSGDRLLKSFQDVTGRWDKWSNSKPGQKAMEDFFQKTEPVTEAVGKLAGSLAELFVKLSSDGQGPLMGFLWVLQSLADVLNWLSDIPFVGAGLGWIATLAGVGGALGMLVGVIASLRSGLATLSMVTGITKAFDLWREGTLLLTFQLKLLALQEKAVAIWQGIVTAATAAWNTVLAMNPVMLIVIGILALIAALVYAYKHVEWFRKAVDKAVDWIVKGFQWLWDFLFGHSVIPDIVDGLKWAGNLIKAIFKKIVGVVKVLGKWFGWLWDHAIKPAWKAISAAVKLAWRYYYKPILKLLWNALKFLGKVVMWLWDHAVKPAWKAISKAIQEAWKKILKPTFEVLWAALKEIGKWTKWLWEKAIRPAWNAIRDGIKKVWRDHLKPTFDTLTKFIKETIPNAFREGVKAIKGFWSDLQDIARKPVEFIVNTVYMKGIKPVIDAIPGVDNLPTVHFARGGILPGYTPGRDVHDFVSPTAGRLSLSGGEGIAIPQVVRAIGARGWKMLNDAGRRGRGAVLDALVALGDRGHEFARGGIVYVDGEPMSRLAAAQLAVANQVSGLGMRVMQGSYQPYTPYSGSSHMGGGVMDTSPGSFSAQSWLRKLAFAAWARNIPGAAQAGSGAHVHSVSRIDPESAGHAQLSSFARGEDGLGGSDYGPNPSPVKELVDRAIALAGVLPTTMGGGSGGAAVAAAQQKKDGWRDVIGTVMDFVKKVPGYVKQLTNLGAWGPMLVKAIKSGFDGMRTYINDKIPDKIGPLPFPDNPIPRFFDGGGDWVTGTLGVNASGKTETVFTNRDMVDLGQALATTARTLRSLIAPREGDGHAGLPPLVGELTLHAEPGQMPNLLHDATMELRRIRRGGVHAQRTTGASA